MCFYRRSRITAKIEVLENFKNFPIEITIWPEVRSETSVDQVRNGNQNIEFLSDFINSGLLEIFMEIICFFGSVESHSFQFT